MKKSTLFSSLIAGTLVLSGLPASVMADNWTANTPSEIAQLNKNGTYTVRQGDTIWAIGMHYNIKPQVIEQMNGINNPYALQIGTILNLHIYDHGKKADLTITNTNGVAVKRKLTNKDKLNKHKPFGESINQKELTKKDKNNMNKDLYSNKSEKQSIASSINQKEQSTASSKINLTTTTSAKNYLIQKLGLNSSVGLIVDNTGQNQNGNYYEITLHVKSYEKQGGTGSAGTYRVYQNGNIVELN